MICYNAVTSYVQGGKGANLGPKPRDRRACSPDRRPQSQALGGAAATIARTSSGLRIPRPRRFAGSSLLPLRRQGRVDRRPQHGRGCVYCTMWADGFNGVVPHLEDRAAFVVVSPDEPHVQAEFAASRGWRFRMVAARSDFTGDMGYEEGPVTTCPVSWPSAGNPTAPSSAPAATSLAPATTIARRGDCSTPSRAGLAIGSHAIGTCGTSPTSDSKSGDHRALPAATRQRSRTADSPRCGR